MKTLRLCCLLLFPLLACAAARAESYVALPNASFAVRYPLSYDKCKLYPTQSFEIVSENDDAFFIYYDFGDAVHVVELPKKKNGRTVGFREGKVASVSGMVVMNFDKGVILIEKGTAYPVTATSGDKVKKDSVKRHL